MKHDDPMVSDEGMNVLLAPVVQAVAAYGRAESDRMGAVIVLAAYGVVEFRCRALIRAAVKRGLEIGAGIAQQRPCSGNGFCAPAGAPPAERTHHDDCAYAIRADILALAERVVKEGRT